MKLLMEGQYVHDRDSFFPLVKVNLKPIGRPSNTWDFRQRANIVESHVAEVINPTLVIRWLVTSNEKEEEEWKKTDIPETSKVQRRVS